MASGGALMPCCAMAPGATSTPNTASNPVAKVLILLPLPIQLANHKTCRLDPGNRATRKVVPFRAFIVASIMQFRVRRNGLRWANVEMALLNGGYGPTARQLTRVERPSARRPSGPPIIKKNKHFLRDGEAQ